MARCLHTRVGDPQKNHTFFKKKWKFLPKNLRISAFFDKINLRISAFFNVIICIYHRKSAIVFDEVQECPRARQAIKHLVKDGDFFFHNWLRNLIRLYKNAAKYVHTSPSPHGTGRGIIVFQSRIILPPLLPLYHRSCRQRG